MLFRITREFLDQNNFEQGVGRGPTFSVWRRWSDHGQKLETRWNSLNNLVRGDSQSTVSNLSMHHKLIHIFRGPLNEQPRIFDKAKSFPFISRILAENPHSFLALSETVDALYLKVSNGFFLPENPIIGRGDFKVLSAIHVHGFRIKVNLFMCMLNECWMCMLNDSVPLNRCFSYLTETLKQLNLHKTGTHKHFRQVTVVPCACRNQQFSVHFSTTFITDFIRLVILVVRQTWTIKVTVDFDSMHY